jgi:hypothetical protein
MENLLLPTIQSLRQQEEGWKIALRGVYTEEEQEIISNWSADLEASRGTIQVLPFLPREGLKSEFEIADGFLLLAWGEGIITGKIFEYLVTGKPILAATPVNGDLWRMARDIPQLHVFDPEGRPHEASSILRGYLDACRCLERHPSPATYSEQAFRDRFLRVIDREGLPPQGEDA